MLTCVSLIFDGDRIISIQELDAPLTHWCLMLALFLRRVQLQQSIRAPHYDPPSSNVFARCTESLVSWWLFWLVWWLARSWALVTDCEAYVFTPSMLAGSCSYILIDWASSQQPSPLCLTRSGWGGFAYSLDEMSMKMRGRPSLIQAWHWLPGQQGSDCFAKWLHSIWSLRHSVCAITQNNRGYTKANCCVSALLDWPTLEYWEFFCILDEGSIASIVVCSP